MMSASKSGKKRAAVEEATRGFTLVELLVVIMIIGILISLLLPAVQAAREAARSMQCCNNLKQYATAFHNYHDVHQQFPPGGARSTAGNPGATWTVFILPFMEEAPLYDMIDFRNPSGGHIRETPVGSTKLAGTTVSYARCPSDGYPSVLQTTGGPVAITNYAANRGMINPTSWGSMACSQLYRVIAAPPRPASPWGDCSNAGTCSGIMANDLCWGASIAEITDGTSNTICLGEILPECRSDAQVYGGDMWSYNRIAIQTFTNAPINFDTCPPYTAGNPCDNGNDPNLGAFGFKSRHPGGANLAFCDASVRSLSETMDSTTYWRLGDHADNQIVGSY